MVTYRKKEYVMTDRELALKPDGEQEAAEAQASAPVAEKPKFDLPDGIPELIEVDLGRSKGWTTATVTKVSGRWLHYALAETGEKGKVQLVGRGIVWREDAA